MDASEEFDLLADRNWRPMNTAPRDGTIILLTWIHNGKPQEIFSMLWEGDATNELFAPGVRGMWVDPDGALTWNEDDPEGAPTHWAPEHDA